MDASIKVAGNGADSDNDANVTLDQFFLQPKPTTSIVTVKVVLGVSKSSEIEDTVVTVLS